MRTLNIYRKHRNKRHSQERSRLWAQFSISLRNLSSIGGKLYDISGLKLKLPQNKMYLAPISIDQNLAGAIPIEVWTETSVIGDISNRFGTGLTEKLQFG